MNPPHEQVQDRDDAELHLHNSSSADAAYKKALKHYKKSAQHQKQSQGTDWTAFRAAEKKYKRRFPLCDTSNTLDLALLDETRSSECNWAWKGRADSVPVREIALHSSTDKRKAYCIGSIPGLVLLPGYVQPDQQAALVRWCLQEHSRAPNETNLDTHYDIPSEGLWSMYSRERNSEGSPQLISPKQAGSDASMPVSGPRRLVSNTPASINNYSELQAEAKLPLAPSSNARSATATELIPKLRWANVGWFYHWGTKQYDFSRGKIDVGLPIRSICKEIVRSIDWKDVFEPSLEELKSHSDGVEWEGSSTDWQEWRTSYEPDAGIVNFYQYKDTLMGHVDRSEICSTSPLVSLSLGNSAVFLIGGSSRDEDPTPILLRSGDALVMAGPRCRRAYHGIPRILERSLPAHLEPGSTNPSDWDVFGSYMRTTRININVRQVFPKNFNPVILGTPEVR